MNPVLILLIILAAVILWFLLACLYRPVGRLCKRIYDDAMQEMSDKKRKRGKKK